MATYSTMLGGLGGAGAKQDDAPVNGVAPVERRAEVAYVEEKLQPHVSHNQESVRKVNLLRSNVPTEHALKIITSLRQQISDITHNKRSLSIEAEIDNTIESQVSPGLR